MSFALSVLNVNASEQQDSQKTLEQVVQSKLAKQPMNQGLDAISNSLLIEGQI